MNAPSSTAAAAARPADASGVEPGGARRTRSPQDERLRRRQRLAAALRIFATLGYDDGAGGHLTARDPILPDHFWINPFGRPFGRIRVSDLLLVDQAGGVVAGEGRINPAGYAIHSQIHQARPDVVAAAHTHSVYGRALAALHRRVDPITQDACAFFEDHEVHHAYTGVVLDAAEGRAIARTLGPGKAVVLANHGLLTVGGTVDEAAWWFIALERCCQVQLLAEAVAPPVRIDADRARDTRDQIGAPALGRANFRPLYEAIVHAQPDLLD